MRAAASPTVALRGIRPTPPTKARAQKSVRCSCADDTADAREDRAPTRRAALSAFAFAAGGAAIASPAAYAAYGAASVGVSSDDDEEVTWSTFYGAANPPATYGSLGGTTKAAAKYSYDVASSWKEEPTTKVEKGSGGQDSRWVKRSSREEKAYLLTLNPAGQDGASFELTEAALQAVAGALSEMQDAITSGRVTSSKSMEDGKAYMTYNVDADRKYTVKISLDNTGRIFAFVVTAPASQFNRDKAVLDRMVKSFRVYTNVSQFV